MLFKKKKNYLPVYGVCFLLLLFKGLLIYLFIYISFWFLPIQVFKTVFNSFKFVFVCFLIFYYYYYYYFLGYIKHLLFLNIFGSHYLVSGSSFMFVCVFIN